MENVRTILIDMPCTVKAYTICKDDFYTIVINASLNQEMQRFAYYHELYHIQNKDFERKCSVNLIEINAHGGT